MIYFDKLLGIIFFDSNIKSSPNQKYKVNYKSFFNLQMFLFYSQKRLLPLLLLTSTKLLKKFVLNRN